MADYYRHLERFSAALAFLADVSMGSLGGALKLREWTSARLGDVLSHLHMASATLKGFEEHGATEEDTVHATWALEYHLHAIESAFHDFVRNDPIKALRTLLSVVALPTGRRFSGPSDTLNGRLCDMMSAMTLDSAFGKRMSYDIDIGRGESDPIGRLMAAYDKLREVDPFYGDFLRGVKRGEIEGATIEAQLQDAVAKGRLEERQAEQLREYDVLLTDDFSKEYLFNPHSEEARQAERDAAEWRKVS